METLTDKEQFATEYSPFGTKISAMTPSVSNPTGLSGVIPNSANNPTNPSASVDGQSNGSVDLMNGYYQSAKFISYYDDPTNATGWRIDSYGNAEFNNVLVRGTITASTIDIGSNAWHVDVNGNMWWGPSSTFAGATVKISSGGTVSFVGGSFSGTITASAGTIGGWTIATTSIIGGDISGDPGTSYLELDSSGQIISFLSGEKRMVLDGLSIAFLAPGELGGGSIYSFGVNQLNIDVTGGGLGPDYTFRPVNFYPEYDNTCYLGRYSALIQNAWKGIIVKDTTDGNYYQIEVVSGMVTATLL